MDLRKKLAGLELLQSEIDSLKSPQLTEKLAIMKIHDEAKAARSYFAKSAGAIFSEQQQDLVDKAGKSAFGADRSLNQLIQASGNVSVWKNAIPDTTFLTSAQSFVNAESERDKIIQAVTAGSSIANGLADALKTIDAAEPVRTVDTSAFERVPSMSQHFQRARELEDEKLELARTTAGAMQAALAAAERREVDAKAEAAESRRDAKFFKRVAVVSLVVAVATGFIASWEPVAKWISSIAQQKK